MLAKHRRSEHRNLSVLAWAAVLKPLCVVARPGLGEITQVWKERLCAVKHSLGHVKLKLDFLVVVAQTVAEVAFRVDSGD